MTTAEKITIAVIDDESHVVNRIALAFDWESVNAEVIATFTESREALEKLPYLSPDIVISDIRMPVLDGLALFERIKPLCPYSRFIFMSGFDEFQLVKKALQLGAAAYCLKPVDDEELADALRKISKEIESEKLSLRYILESVIDGNDSSVLHVLASKLGKIEYLNRRFILACSIGDISSELCYYTKFISIEYDINTYFYLIEENGFIKSPGFQNRTEGLLAAERIKGCSWTEADLDETLGAKLRMLSRNVYSSFTGMMLTEMHSDSPFFRKLQEYGKSCDMESMLSLIQRYDDEYAKEQRNVDEAIEIYNTEMAAIFRSQGQVFEDAISAPRELASEFSTLDDMMHYLSEQLASSIAENAGLPIANLKSAVFKDIISYINKEYCERITLQSIAMRFSIAPSYLCQIFQKEIGMTFTKYITRLRIAKAAKLLSETDLPIASVSDESGFSQYYYFAKVFKKTMGVTPSEYRDAQTRR